MTELLSYIWPKPGPKPLILFFFSRFRRFLAAWINLRNLWVFPPRVPGSHPISPKVHAALKPCPWCFLLVYYHYVFWISIAFFEVALWMMRWRRYVGIFLWFFPPAIGCNASGVSPQLIHPAFPIASVYLLLCAWERIDRVLGFD